MKARFFTTEINENTEKTGNWDKERFL